MNNQKIELKPVDFKPFIHGNYEFTDRDGYVGFCHFSKKQTDYLKFNEFFYRRAFFSSSVTLEFKFKKQCVFSFDYKIVDVASSDSLEVFVNGKRAYFYKIAEMKSEGTLEFCVRGDENIVGDALDEAVVYFPIDADFAVKNFKASAEIFKIDRTPKVLWIGDSISQGYGTFSSGESFVNIIRRKMGFELLNQGIGGYYYDCNSIIPLENFVPDRIIIAMGTNLHDWADKEKYISAFYKKLSEVYGGVKTLSITPLWRFDENVKPEEMKLTRELIKEQCDKYNTICLNAKDFIPPEEKYFIDGLHPNAAGAGIYADKVCERLIKTKFFN